MQRIKAGWQAETGTHHDYIQKDGQGANGITQRLTQKGCCAANRTEWQNLLLKRCEKYGNVMPPVAQAKGLLAVSLG